MALPFWLKSFCHASEKIWTRPPSPRMAAPPDLSQIPPAEIPDALQDGIAKLSAPLKQLLMGKSVPYLIQHRLGSENYVTVEADRWDSAQVAHQQGPRELGFEANHNGFTAASSGFAAMKLFQVVRAAKEMIQTHPSVLATPGPGPSRPLSLSEVLCERPQLEKEFAAKWGIPKPQYRDQGSDALLRRQYKFCSKGEIGFIHSKYIISALPEEGERPIKTRKKITVDGWEKEEEEEERAAPTTSKSQPPFTCWLRCVKFWFQNTVCWGSPPSARNLRRSTRAVWSGDPLWPTHSRRTGVTTPQNRRMPLSKASWHKGNPSTSLRHWHQLVTARSAFSVRGEWNVSSIPSAPPAAAVRCLLFQLGWTGRWDSSPSLISGKRTFSESEAVSTEESVRELNETDESESTACAGASWTPQSLGSLNLWKHLVQWKRSAASVS